MGIIIKPIVTEKQTQITAKKANRVGFRVSPDANKKSYDYPQSYHLAFAPCPAGTALY